MNNPTPILGQARAEGYRDGVGQMSQVAFDDAYEQGRMEGWNQRVAGLRLRWVLFGMVLGYGIGSVLA